MPSPTPCAADGVVVADQLPSNLAGALDLRVYLPPCYADGRRYPTLYMLPGNIHDETIWDELGIDETATAGVRDGRWSPFIIVMADGGWLADNSSGGPGSYETVIVSELIPYIEANYCAWEAGTGRAIGGMSRGGYWALEIAFQHPQLFAGVGGHSAALLDSAAWPAINPQYTGLSADLGNLGIYLDIGNDDYVIYNIRRLHEEMTAAAPPVAHTWVLNEGGHDEAYWQAQLPAYLAWYTSLWPVDRSAIPACP